MKSIVHRFLLLFGLLLVASPAFAVTVDLGGYSGGTFNPTMYNAWNIYAFGDASVIVNILESISSLVGSSDYHSMLLFVSMLSFLGMAIVASISGTMQGSGIKMLLMFIGLVFLIDVGFGDTVNLEVISPLGFSSGGSGTSSGPSQSYGQVMPIANIPFIVGVPESVITTFGHELAKLFQTNFNTPTDLGVLDGGFNLSSSLVNAESKLQITNSNFESTLTQFSQNCIMPSIAAGRLNPSVIAMSTTLFSTVPGSGGYQNVNPALSTYIYNSDYPQGDMVPCAPAISSGNAGNGSAPATPSASNPGDAYDYIAWYLKNNTTVSGLNPADFGIESFSTTGGNQWLQTAVGSANSLLLNNASTTAAENVEQAAVINGLNPALREAAALSGTSGQMMDIAVAQGEQQEVSGWATAAAIFKQMSGYLYAVLQAMVLGMLPIVIIAMFIPGTGIKLVGSYLQVAVWLALWQPLLAIVNYIVMLYAQAQSGTILEGATGFTMQNLPVISQFTSRMMLAGSFMATMVPLFAWGIVKGGMAVTDLITQGLGQSIMAQAGATAATGNVTLGNRSMDDDTINQKMLMPKYSVGYGMVNAGIDGNGITADWSQGGNGKSVAGMKDSNTTTFGKTAAFQTAVKKLEAEGMSASSAYSEAASQINKMAGSIMAEGGQQGSAGTGGNSGQDGGLSRTALKGLESRIDNGLNNLSNDTKSNSFSLSGFFEAALGGDGGLFSAKAGVKGSAKAEQALSNALVATLALGAIASGKVGKDWSAGQRAAIMNEFKNVNTESMKEVSTHSSELASQASKTSSVVSSATKTWDRSQAELSSLNSMRNVTIQSGFDPGEGLGAISIAGAGGVRALIARVNDSQGKLAKINKALAQGTSGLHPGTVATPNPSRLIPGVNGRVSGARGISAVSLGVGDGAYAAHRQQVDNQGDFVQGQVNAYNKSTGNEYDLNATGANEEAVKLAEERLKLHSQQLPKVLPKKGPNVTAVDDKSRFGISRP